MTSSNIVETWKERIKKHRWYVADNTHGTIVFANTSDPKESLFGITVSLDFFISNANERIMEAFLKKLEAPTPPHKHQLIPMLIMSGDGTWSLQFKEDTARIVLFDSLWKDAEISEKCINRFWAFTQRDGSLYYSKFFSKISYFRRCIHMFPNGVVYHDAKEYILGKSIEVRLLRSMMENANFRFDLRKGTITVPVGRKYI